MVRSNRSARRQTRTSSSSRTSPCGPSERVARRRQTRPRGCARTSRRASWSDGAHRARACCTGEASRWRTPRRSSHNGTSTARSSAARVSAQPSSPRSRRRPRRARGSPEVAGIDERVAMSGLRPFVLIVLDGWGFSSNSFGNAIGEARTPEMDALMRRWPNTLVAASGEAVGLPRGQQGNSEVGHLTIGAGRVVYQPLSRINRAIADGSFFDNVALIDAAYAENITDEFIPPASIVDGRQAIRVADGDSVVFFNFRPDRARQLSHALVEPDFAGFERSRRPGDLAFVTFTEYERGFPALVAFPREDVRETLAEVVSREGLHQFHVAETEKYAHVTYFINGGRERAFKKEERLLVPSPRVATYDGVPEMSAAPVTDAVIAHVTQGVDALIVVNFANADMVGHTGDFAATVRAVEFVDACVGRIVRTVLDRG